MTDITLNQAKKCFVEWRSQRQRREPIPEDLWRIACNQIPAAGITRVAREFRLNDNKLREKAIQFGITLSRVGKQENTRRGKATFQEISLDHVLMPAISSISLVLERPDGMRVRIEGQLPEPEYVSRLAASFLK
jgi:hypothetical protein